MRFSWRGPALMLAAVVMLAAGCGGDVAARLKTDVAFQTQVMGAFAENPELAGKMVDLLLAGNTRPVVVERVLGNGTVVQDLMTKIAQDRTILDGVLNLAVQDTAMRSHILTLFTGMKMMGGK